MAGSLLMLVAIVALVVIQLLRSDDPDLATEAPQITTTPGSPTAAATGATGATGSTGNAAVPAGTRKFVIVPAESSAKYVVEETLRGLVTNAVGTTSVIPGEIYLTPSGLASGQTSSFKVDLSTLKSDEGQRDNFIKQNTLQTSRHQYAEFTVKSLSAFPANYVENTQVELTLTGTMKIRDIGVLSGLARAGLPRTALSGRGDILRRPGRYRAHVAVVPDIVAEALGDHPIARPHVLHRRAHFMDLADELVTECHPDPSVGHHAVVEVQVRSTDRRTCHPHDRIVGMLDRRDLLLLDTDPVGPAIHHRAHAYLQ
jgi:polyisoprenoid-binding protein YceI